MSFNYAGDLTPKEAYDLLNANGATKIIDVRTKAEAIFVGVPIVSNANNQANSGAQSIYCMLEWQLFPSMQKNDNFVEQLNAMLVQWQSEDNIANEARALLFLCRSGVRSKHAADVATQMGCHKSYNITGGFEGDVDENGHRANLSGWKFSGLPWSQ